MHVDHVTNERCTTQSFQLVEWVTLFSKSQLQHFLTIFSSETTSPYIFLGALYKMQHNSNDRQVLFPFMFLSI